MLHASIAPLLPGLLDLAQDAQTRTASTVDAEKRRLLKALDAKTARLSADFRERASAFILAHLAANGATSGEALTDACKQAAITPPQGMDDRAFGPVYQRLAQANQIRACGSTTRRRGHGTSGGRVWERVG